VLERLTASVLAYIALLSGHVVIACLLLSGPQEAVGGRPVHTPQHTVSLAAERFDA
jgi:hypothetical protein